MKTITCPRCGAPIAIYRAFRPTIKPFCARCGWNLERAKIAAAGSSPIAKFVPVFIIAIAVLIGFSAASRNSSPLAWILPLLIGGIALIPLWMTFSNRKAVEAAMSSVNPTLAQAQPPVDPQLQQLQAMPRPRRVRFRVPGALLTVLALTLIVGFGGLYLATRAKPTKPTRGTSNIQVHTRSNPTGILVVPMVFVVLLVVPYFRDKRNLPLMRDGELALGKVTYQQNVMQGKSSYSRIGYEFKTSSGQLIQDQAKDLTYTVYEDMIIPVFYDPANPARNVTPCATYLQVCPNPF
jgi:uncharacterized protein (DUF983 family)